MSFVKPCECICHYDNGIYVGVYITDNTYPTFRYNSIYCTQCKTVILAEYRLEEDGFMELNSIALPNIGKYLHAYLKVQSVKTIQKWWRIQLKNKRINKSKNTFVKSNLTFSTVVRRS